MSLIQGRTGDWEVVIGLEVHAQVVAKSKLFSGASTEFGAEPNTQVSLVDAAMPGMLPVINETAVEQAVRTGLGLNAEIHLKSIFDRKNYFYPDLPQGYQISQYLHPVVGKGEIEIDLEDGTTRTIGITRLHLEQDAGKSLHDQDPGKTLIDLNRSGVALMEIVSEPDLRSAEEAGAYVEKIRSILRYLGTCDGNMQEGSLRADVNVSVRKPGHGLGTRTEIKNVNSIRFIRQAIDCEVQRQIELIEDGGEVDQETRLFDSDRGETRSMRSKEEAHDYRYFPDPDLLPLEFGQSWVETIRDSLPEMPDQRKSRFIEDYGLSAEDAGTLVADRETAQYFETVADGRNAKVVANWIMGELFGALNRADIDIEASPVSARQLGQLVDLIDDGTVSTRLAKDVFEIMFQNGDDPQKIVENRGMKQVTDHGAIEAAVDEAISKGATQVEQYKGGNEKVFGWFVGQVMRATHGKANPQVVNEFLRKKLDR
ncbi:MAG: Aspartyl/glutamyl-tRNA(Asn/Gln) amidotransferase subunit B [Alphaproteobacteria bacterium MarineAlpha11_Bin1]|nr:MAG: Aspartyl/glutamyl-tRNA(Asn/Gln) amidotransferase subunit B [Alphaproteobacteria bacterium MarineAlpha11_Bin1]|tara:strand:+ start:1267 stop:2718 length:1452 start_codon:yes stop_codon:yes gene_type:complete